MGNYIWIIKGVGQHHNDGDEKDADVIFQKTVDELKDAGHSIESAEFIHNHSTEIHED